MKQVFLCVFLVVHGLSCTKRDGGVENILIKGSDTEVNVALALAERYMEKEPLASIAVTGGGSGTGIAALLNGRTSIANASRPMNADEYRVAAARGIRPLPIVVGMDALAIVVHASNPLDSLDMDDLGRIFRGEIATWAEFGGPSQQVSLYGRQSNSGTFLFFRDQVLRAEYGASLKQMNGTAQIIEGIATDPAGVGYVGIGYLSGANAPQKMGVKVLKITKKYGEPAFSPLVPEHVQRGEYPIVRPLFQFINGQPQRRLLDFLMFTIGEEGQAIVRQNGYYPISEEQYAEDVRLLHAEIATQ